MTCRRGRCPDDLLEAAVRRYSAAFPGRELPVLQGIGGRGGEAFEVAVVMLCRAVATDEPLDPWAVMAALGVRRPPGGPDA